MQGFLLKYSIISDILRPPTEGGEFLLIYVKIELISSFLHLMPPDEEDWTYEKGYYYDENGVCDGSYNYRNGKVYFRLGGTMNVNVYKIEDGELVQQ